jgi:regulation of enolase protein 1 (concanavalin A-like superfamily)
VKRLTLLCWLAAWAALAAPVPEPKGSSGFEGPEWGKPVGTNKDCKFTFTKGSLTIEVPGKKGRVVAPRLLRPAKGDFEVQVRVRGDFRVSPDDDFGQLTAGLVVLDKDEPTPSYRAVFGARCTGPRRGAPPAALNRELYAEVMMEDTVVIKNTKRGLGCQTNPPTKGWAVPAAGKPWEAYLKVTRRGGELKSYLSPDGKKWSLNARPSLDGRPPHLALMPEDKIAGEVRVGVAAFNLSADKCKVTFDQWKFTPLKAEAKAKAEKKAEGKAEKKAEGKPEKKTEKK